MDVKLDAELEKFVQERVRSGRYRDASDVIREALLVVRELDDPSHVDARELRREIERGLSQADRGEVIPWDVAKMKERVHKAVANQR